MYTNNSQAVKKIQKKGTQVECLLVAVLFYDEREFQESPINGLRWNSGDLGENINR